MINVLFYRTLDVSLLPHFECSMNIWDDNKYNNCMIEENVDINYSINLSVCYSILLFIYRERDQIMNRIVLILSTS